MRLWKKRLFVVLGAGLLAALFAGNTWAAEEREKISGVNLAVKSSIEVGGDSSKVTVTSSDKGYEVAEVNVLNDQGKWLRSDVPRVEVILKADDDYYFASIGRSNVTLTGSGAEYLSSRRTEENSVLTVTIKLDALQDLFTITGVRWESKKDPVAVWKSKDGAKSYELRLHCMSADGRVGTMEGITVKTKYFDFSNRITEAGYYYFEVCVVNRNGVTGDWYKSEYFQVDAGNLDYIKRKASSSSSGRWVQDQAGWRYFYDNDKYPMNEWKKLNNLWYHFNESGYMQVGWLQDGGNWYYCDTTPGSHLGAMLINTTTPDGYWVDASGKWSSAGGQQTPTGGGQWMQDQTGWWYCYANGTYPMASWQQIDGRWYYFEPSGYMHIGWIQTGGDWYYCDTTPGNNLGVMLTNTITPDGNRVDANGVWVP